MAARDAEALVALSHPEIFVEPASTEIAERAPYHGHDGLRAYVADLQEDWDEFDISISEVREGPRHIVALGRVYARSGGAIADGPAAFVVEVRDGLVVWWKTFRDRAAGLRHAGLES